VSGARVLHRVAIAAVLVALAYAGYRYSPEENRAIRLDESSAMAP
jgi:hypothetical protein